MEEPLIYRNLQWLVDAKGNLICNDNHYEISRCTFDAIDWHEHMREKRWCNMFYFRQAYEYSLKNTTA